MVDNHKRATPPAGHGGGHSQRPLPQDTVVDTHSDPSRRTRRWTITATPPTGSLVSHAKQQIPHMTVIMHLFTQPKHLTLPLRRNALEAINRLCSTFHRHGIRSNSFSKVSYFGSLISTPFPFLPPLQTTSPDAALHFNFFSLEDKSLHTVSPCHTKFQLPQPANPVKVSWAQGPWWLRTKD